MEQDFIAILRKSGNSLCITVPKQIVKFLELKDKDMLKIRIKKAK